MIKHQWYLFAMALKENIWINIYNYIIGCIFLFKEFVGCFTILEIEKKPISITGCLDLVVVPLIYMHIYIWCMCIWYMYIHMHICSNTCLYMVYAISHAKDIDVNLMQQSRCEDKWYIIIGYIFRR